MTVRIEKILATVLDEAQDRQVGEAIVIRSSRLVTCL
jgi:hypothetical protein